MAPLVTLVVVAVAVPIRLSVLALTLSVVDVTELLAATFSVEVGCTVKVPLVETLLLARLNVPDWTWTAPVPLTLPTKLPPSTSLSVLVPRLIVPAPFRSWID